MRYPPEHRRQKKREIVRAAARLFRERGYEGVGIDTIMEACGLTRGGFYGYFRSKEDLFAETLRDDHDFIERLRERRGTSRRELLDGSLEVLSAYLDPANRDPVVRGCSIAALSIDAGRHPAVRDAYGAAVRNLSAELARGLEEPRPDDERTLAAIALCVGGLLVSRAVSDPELADRLERAASRAARHLLEARPGLLSSTDDLG